MKKFLGYVSDRIIKSLPRNKKVAPDIKSVKPTKDISGSVKKVYAAEESKRIDKTIASKEKMKAGKKMMREGQKELRKQIDTGTAFKFKGGKTGEKTFAIKPGENIKKQYKGLIDEGKPQKKFKTGKQLDRENKMGGGMMGRRFGMRLGTPKPKTNIQKIKETFAPKGKNLKPVDPKKQKGLAKLPKQVRNKMGYMKSGGRAGFKGGGADTGKLGELKSKLGVGQIKLAKAQEDLRKIKRLKKKLGMKND
jgi:hypothetical protein